MDSKLLFLALVLGSPVLALKVVVMSDIHYNVLYRPDISEDTYCADEANASPAKTYAPYGRIGCDPPESLFNRFVMRLNETEKPDLLFLPGDFIGHGTPIKTQQPYNSTRYALLMDIH